MSDIISPVVVLAVLLFILVVSLAPRHRTTPEPAEDHPMNRQDLARHLYSLEVQGSRLDMLEYDHNPRLQGSWLVEADRRMKDAA